MGPVKTMFVPFLRPFVRGNYQRKLQFCLSIVEGERIVMLCIIYIVFLPLMTLPLEAPEVQCSMPFSGTSR